jgi:outer membrane protein OmpA-like peptidoglycan-associated protein
MKIIIPFAAMMLGLVACVAGPPTPPPRSVTEYPAALPTAVHHPEARAAIQQNTEETRQHADVKPLGKGELTAQNVEPYMDAQERELRIALRGSGTVVSRVGDNLAVRIPAAALFSGDSDAISGDGRAILTKIALDVRKYDSTRISVSGFTDTRGTPAQAKQNSERRAKAVKDTLATDGVNSRRIDAKGLGAENARVPTAANVAEPRNRRVEIEISPVMKG